jgi:hypothetical protein
MYVSTISRISLGTPFFFGGINSKFSVAALGDKPHDKSVLEISFRKVEPSVRGFPVKRNGVPINDFKLLMSFSTGITVVGDCGGI